MHTIHGPGNLSFVSTYYKHSVLTPCLSLAIGLKTHAVMSIIPLQHHNTFPLPVMFVGVDHEYVHDQAHSHVL